MGIIRASISRARNSSNWSHKCTEKELDYLNSVFKTNSSCGGRSSWCRFLGVRNVHSEAVQQRSHATRDANQSKASKERSHTSEKDLLLSVLNASTTKREAKSYLSRFKSGNENFTSNAFQTSDGKLHVAVVKLRSPGSLENRVLDGVGRTLSQLAHLGLHSVVVLEDSLPAQGSDITLWREKMISGADKVVTAISKTNSCKVRRMESLISVTTQSGGLLSDVPVQSSVNLEHEGVLLDSLKSGNILVIPSLAYTVDSQKSVGVQADDVVLALTRTFAGLGQGDRQLQHATTGRRQLDDSIKSIVSLDRIILLDPLGGIPSTSRPDQSHVFVNLEQEFQDIKRELDMDRLANSHVQFGVSSGKTSSASQSNTISRFTEEETAFSPAQAGHPAGVSDQIDLEGLLQRQSKNLELLSKSLALLPPTSSALLTTPTEAMTVEMSSHKQPADFGVGTRRPRNPLIYNLLTDKPLVSSSLPVSRFSSTDDVSASVHKGASRSNATFFKKGMAVTMVPDPRQQPWIPIEHSEPAFDLNDPRIDFSRLLDLIEDSFNRSLDVEHYLNRIRKKLAGIIVAGEYEGGAILTWEMPPGVTDDGGEESRERMVPYLDKFAVRKRSQGSGGVADIVFSAMVRSCFPKGVCWRSRKNNPVNKWYFERSLGAWKLPGTEWAMFWTTDGLLQDRQRFLDYEGVCRTVEPSWADKKHILD